MSGTQLGLIAGGCSEFVDDGRVGRWVGECGEEKSRNEDEKGI